MKSLHIFQMLPSSSFINKASSHQAMTAWIGSTNTKKEYGVEEN